VNLTKLITALMVVALLIASCMAAARSPPVGPEVGHWQTWVLASFINALIDSPKEEVYMHEHDQVLLLRFFQLAKQQPIGGIA
jgi:hypothetical protein